MGRDFASRIRVLVFATSLDLPLIVLASYERWKIARVAVSAITLVIFPPNQPVEPFVKGFIGLSFFTVTPFWCVYLAPRYIMWVSHN